MTDTHDKIRALFLSALMVLSVFGMATAFAGTAAANHAEEQIDAEDGDRLWAGQTGNFSVTADADTEAVDLYQGDDTDGEWIREVDVEDGDYVLIDTAGLDTGSYFIDDDSQDGVSFEIRVQNLDGTEFSDDTTEQGTVDLTIDSNRADFLTEVSSDDLDEDQLEDIFGGAEGFNQTASDAGDHEGFILLDDRGDFEADFSDVEPGDYEFELDVADSDASTTVEITVEEFVEPDADAEFVNAPYQGIVGDELTIELETEATDEMNVTVEGTGYNAELVLEDVDDEVEISFNTFAAGQGDVSESYSVDGATLDADNSTETEFGEGFVLQPDDFDLAVTVGENEDESDFAGMSLLDRETGDATTLIAPASVEELDTDDLSAWTERETVAVDDSVAVQVEVTGVFAYLDDNVSANGTDFSLELQNPGAYQTGESLNGSSDGVDLVRNEENGTIYFVIDMDEAPVEFEAGQEWEATFSISDENPYVDDEESASSSFTVTERAVSLNVVEEPYQMTPTEDSVAEGESTLAPGTEVNVRFRMGGADGFVVRITDEVSEDGNWSVTHDFSDREEEEEFGIRLRASGVEDQNYDAAFSDTPESETVADVEALNDRIAELEEENENLQDEIAMVEAERDQLQEDLENAESERDEASERADEAESERDDLQSQVDELEQENENLQATIDELEAGQDDGDDDTPADSDGQPGFGIGIAVVALLAAALLAVRRQA